MFSTITLLPNINGQSDFYSNTKITSTTKSYCGNKICFHFDNFYSIIIYDFKKNKNIVIDHDGLFPNKKHSIFYKNKHIHFNTNPGDIQIRYNKNIFSKYYYDKNIIKKKYEYYEDENYGDEYSPHNFFCKKTKLLFIIVEPESFNVLLLKIYKFKSNKIEQLNTLCFDITVQCVTDVVSYDYKKKLLKIKYKKNDEFFFGDLQLKNDIFKKIEIQNVVKITTSTPKNIISENKTKNYNYSLTKKYDYKEKIFKTHSEKNNNDKFFRINKINRYNNKIKKIVKYMLIDGKYKKHLIEDLINVLYQNEQYD